MSIYNQENKLTRPLSQITADPCREMGVAVGDTIQGREEYPSGWNEARITLLWIGKTETIWNEQRKNQLHFWNWSPVKESSSQWDLCFRDWYRVPQEKEEQP